MLSITHSRNSHEKNKIFKEANEVKCDVIIKINVSAHWKTRVPQLVFVSRHVISFHVIRFSSFWGEQKHEVLRHIFLLNFIGCPKITLVAARYITYNIRADRKVIENAIQRIQDSKKNIQRLHFILVVKK